MCAWIVGSLFQQPINLLLRILKLVALNQQVCEVDSRLVILGTQFEGAGQLLVSTVPLLQVEVGLRELEVCIGVAPIDLDSIGKLDCRFLVLPF